jgi:ribosomal protein L28
MARKCEVCGNIEELGEEMSSEYEILFLCEHCTTDRQHIINE